MLPSSKLVLQAQGIISDSEDSKGYLSEGEQYRQSRFPRTSKSANDISIEKHPHSPVYTRLTREQDEQKITQNSPPSLFKDAISKKRAGRLHYKTTKEFGYDTTSESELSDIEKSCPFYFASLHKGNARKNIFKKDYENEPYKTGNFTGIIYILA